MNLYLITGMSGAGKSLAVDTLEDRGFYCVDNVPAQLIYSFVTLLSKSMPDRSVAIVSDSRSSFSKDDFFQAVNNLKRDNIEYKIIYLDSSSDVLQSRFKETRRKHPLIMEAGGILPDAIELERQNLSAVKAIADYVVDTTDTTTATFRERILGIFGEGGTSGLQVMCMSYGTKYGGVDYADLQFDVRCLPNPFYVPELRSQTGLDEDVRNFVMGTPEAVELRDKLFELIDFLLPLYEREGKTQIVIAFCCTGGQHRSVTFAELAGEHISALGYPVIISHRDADRHSAK